MRGKDLLDKLELADDKYVNESAEYKKKDKNIVWKIITIAAALALVIAALPVTNLIMKRNMTTPIDSIGHDKYSEKDTAFVTNEIADYKDTESTSDGLTVFVTNEIADYDTESTPDVPTVVVFSSLSSIKDFISAANESEAIFEKYIEDNHIDSKIIKDTAKTISDNIKNNKIPVISEDVVADDFGATYYLNRQELDVIYNIDGVRYRFILSYNSNETHIYDGKSVVNGISVTPYLVDLYQGDGCLIGSIKDGTTIIRIIVYSQNMDEIHFDLFRLNRIEV